MLDFIFFLDKQFFFLINHLPHNIISDSFFSFISGIGTWGIIWLAIISILLLWEEIQDKKGFFALILAILIAVIIGDLVIKNIIQRPRPEFVLDQVIVVADKRRSFSFPSGHTAIAFAAAYILSKEHRKWGLYYFLLAVLVAFSRIYLGKHFPSDILGGILFGLIIGNLSLVFVRNIGISKHAKRKIKINKKKRH